MIVLMSFSPPPQRPETPGDRVRRQREHLKLTVRQLADLAGVNKETVVDVENGRKAPQDRTWAKLAEALKAPEAWLRHGAL